MSASGRMYHLSSIGATVHATGDGAISALSVEEIVKDAHCMSAVYDSACDAGSFELMYWPAVMGDLEEPVWSGYWPSGLETGCAEFVCERLLVDVRRLVRLLVVDYLWMLDISVGRERLLLDV